MRSADCISVTGAELFAFQLINNTASGVTVDQVQFQLSGVSGIAQGDFANLTIYVDANNDGTIGTGETTTVGGTGVVNSGVTEITFSTNFNIASGVTVNYILKGDVSNLMARGHGHDQPWRLQCRTCLRHSGRSAA